MAPPTARQCGSAAKAIFFSSALRPVRSKEKIRSATPAFRFLSWNLSIPTQKFKFVGRVIERRSDAQLKYYDAMSRKFVSKPWPYRDEKEPIVLLIEVKRVRYSKQPFDHTPPSRGFLEPK